MADRKNFDVAAAKAAGYTDREIEEHLYGKTVAAENAKFRAEGGTTGNFVEDALAGAGKAFTDMSLGGRQFIASFAPKKVSDLVGGGEVEKLNREAAEKKRIDEPLSDTVAGQVGDIGTQVLTSALPTGAAVRAARLIPRLPGIRGAVTAATRFAAPGATIGAAQGVLTPDENYDPTDQAALGSAGGVVGDVVGRVAGRVVNPAIRMAGQKGRETLAAIREAFPNARLNAENLTDNKYVKILTNLLSDTPVASSGVARARNQNLGDVTEMVTGNTGRATREVSPSTLSAAEQRVGREAEDLRTGYVPTTGMSARLMRSLDPERQAMEITGNVRPNVRTVGRAAAAVHPGGPPFATGGGTPAGYNPNVSTILPADAAMTARLEMQSPTSEARRGLSDAGARAVQNEMENALRLGKTPSRFDRWLAEHAGTSTLRDLEGTPNAITRGGLIRPEAVQDTFTGLERTNPPTPFHRAINAAADRFSTPKDEMSRTLMQRVLAGAAIPTAATAIGGLAGYGTGDKEKGIATGAGSLYLAHLLLGTPGGGRYLTGTNTSRLGRALQSDAIKKYFRAAGITGGVNTAEDQ